MTAPEGAADTQPEGIAGLFKGMGAVLAGHVLFPGLVYVVEVAVSGGTSGYWVGLGMFFGVVQLLWVVPLAIWAGVTGRKRFLQGVLILAGLAFLANSACWGLFGLGMSAG